MSVYVRILQESPIKLWGLSSRERLERMLTKAGVSCGPRDENAVAGKDSVLLLRGDFLYDQRIIKKMVDSVGIVLEAGSVDGPRPVAAHVSAELADRMEAILSDVGPHDYPQGLRQETPETLVNAYQMELLKFDAPYLLPISDKSRLSL